MKTAWDVFLSSKAVKWMQNHVLISASIIFIICVSIGAIIIANGFRQKRPEGVQEVIGNSEVTSVVASEESISRELEYESHETVRAAMEEYYGAIGSGDAERISKCLPYVTDMQLKIMKIQSSYLETYEDIKCYTQKGLEDGSYYVYVTYLAKFKDFEVSVPAIDGFYLAPKEEGGFQIYRDSDMPQEIKEDCAIAYQEEAVQELYDTVKVEYNSIVDSNVELAEFVNGFEDELRDELARQIAIEENNKTLEQESQNPPEETDLATPQTSDEVTAITTVNVRSSDSETADRIGKVGQGTTLTRLEEKVNGWSKVIYDGKEAYIKTEFLQAVVGSEAPTSATVTTTTGVNLRAKADEDSERVALAESGTRLELVEKLTNGWTKVKYNGKEAYVKSEYVQ